MGLFPKQMFEGTNWRKKHGEPQNASQLFQCVFTDQLFSLIPVNLLYLVFYLPAIAWTAICLIQLVSAAQATDASLVLATINTYTLGPKRLSTALKIEAVSWALNFVSDAETYERYRA